MTIEAAENKFTELCKTFLNKDVVNRKSGEYRRICNIIFIEIIKDSISEEKKYDFIIQIDWENEVFLYRLEDFNKTFKIQG